MTKSFKLSRAAAKRALIIAAPALAVSLLLGATVAYSGADGPSFNCRKAKAPDEKAVCASHELSHMDWQLQDLYKTVNGCALMGARGAYHDDQVDWLASRHKCGGDTTCLRKVYKKRIGELTPDAANARKQRKAGQCPDQ